ncbi:large subunit ribosomal protein L23 [Geosmithia morbida]|uniref:Large ribosomal subunit protein uL23m n=1 Tax=Geosmithia morbida TaxID=1094350 RepID=A0A9P4Z4K0_9HYPO|nr:large subunit ribosomal protein L23 [Geosmithia morbida]KAF4126539.1 large subunit ribosomal protein L23 [Geosmithia morbida]
MAEVAKAAARQLPGFKLGRKQVFLPDHVITFLRKEHLPPNEACFQVPLRWTKFDLRDYLWNLYGVEVRKVRSYVKELPLAQRAGLPNSWYRPQSKKIMTVELAKPFQWPELPDNKRPWNKEMWDMRQELMEERQQANVDFQRGNIPLESSKPESRDRKELRELAKKMLSGEIAWSNNVELDPKWKSIVTKAKGEAGLKEEATVEAAAEPAAPETKDKT